MKNQLIELLTNYGEIGGIWFDGHWDQTAEEGATDRSSRIDWKYDEIYRLIHKLQPQCLIKNEVLIICASQRILKHQVDIQNMRLVFVFKEQSICIPAS